MHGREVPTPNLLTRSPLPLAWTTLSKRGANADYWYEAR